MLSIAFFSFLGNRFDRETRAQLTCLTFVFPQVGEPLPEPLRADTERPHGEERETIPEGTGQGRQESSNQR